MADLRMHWLSIICRPESKMADARQAAKILTEKNVHFQIWNKKEPFLHLEQTEKQKSMSTLGVRPKCALYEVLMKNKLNCKMHMVA